MRKHTRTGRAAITSTALLAVLVLSATPVHAAAIVTDFVDVHDTQVFTAPLDFCGDENDVGTVTVTETSVGKSVETGSGVFQIHGTDYFEYLLVFPDGSYVESGLNRDLFTFVATPAQTVFKQVTQDFRTIYSADGIPTGTMAVHAVFQIAYRDGNGNGLPDDGEITSEVENFHFRCSL